MKTVLVQHGSGNYARLLQVTDAPHRAACLAAGFTFITDARCFHHTPCWQDKASAIYAVATELDDQDVLIWTDADTAIVGNLAHFQAPLFADARVALVRNVSHVFNTGVIYMRVSDALRDAWRTVAHGPKITDKLEFNYEVLRALARLQPIPMPTRFNTYAYARGDPGGPTVIRGWHHIESLVVRQRFMEAVYAPPLR